MSPMVEFAGLLLPLLRRQHLHCCILKMRGLTPDGDLRCNKNEQNRTPVAKSATERPDLHASFDVKDSKVVAEVE